MRYRFWLICINYNFDFLVLYKMYFQNYFARRSIILESFTSNLQHSRPCCIRYTNSRLRLEFVYLIQHGRSCCKYYLKPALPKKPSFKKRSLKRQTCCKSSLLCALVLLTCSIIIFAVDQVQSMKQFLDNLLAIISYISL